MRRTDLKFRYTELNYVEYRTNEKRERYERFYCTRCYVIYYLGKKKRLNDTALKNKVDFRHNVAVRGHLLFFQICLWNMQWFGFEINRKKIAYTTYKKIHLIFGEANTKQRLQVKDWFSLSLSSFSAFRSVGLILSYLAASLEKKNTNVNGTKEEKQCDSL